MPSLDVQFDTKTQSDWSKKILVVDGISKKLNDANVRLLVIYSRAYSLSLQYADLEVLISR